MKRIFDIVFSIALIILMSPILLILYILVFLILGRPVFFKQKRPGLNGIPFKIIKFRTMKNIVNDKGVLLSNELRMTKVGKLLRSLSLDEIPELFNVLSGEMSFVGPRPLLMEYLPLFNDLQKKRHLVRPGITGWAQINGRNAITWEEKLKYDLWYVENQNFLLDLRILFITIIKVVKCEGITHEGSVGMPRFTGTN